MRAGGWLEVSGPSGQCQIARYPSARRQSAAGRSDESPRPTATGHGDQLVKTLLANVNEATFNNVFAVSLSEMQELAALGDAQAADLFYNITAGLDRVSLIEVTRELEATRSQIIDPQAGPCQMTQLMTQREQVCRQIADQQSHLQIYYRLAGDCDLLTRELAQLPKRRKRNSRGSSTSAIWPRHYASDGVGNAHSARSWPGWNRGLRMPADAIERLEAIKQQTSRAPTAMQELQHRHRASAARPRN